MKLAIAAFCLLTVVTCAHAQSYGSYGGQLYTYQAVIGARVSGDIASTTGTTKVRTQGDTLFFESSLNNAVSITAVHIHLSPSPNVADGGPLVLALTNTSASVGLTPLSSPANGPLVQTGTRNTANLLANPNLPAARAQLIALGITDNTLQNIGDVDRLLARGILYGDVHSLARVSPNRVGSGQFVRLPANQGRRLFQQRA